LRDRDLQRVKAEVCLRCGARCCRGIDYKSWYIRVTLRDIVRISRALCLDVYRFIENYIVLIPQGLYSIPVLKAVEGSCIFLKETLCMIHHVKPIACRVYPVVPPGEKLDVRCPLSRFPELLARDEARYVRQYVEEFLETERLLAERRVKTVRDLARLVDELGLS